MASQYGTERDRGAQESWQQLRGRFLWRMMIALRRRRMWASTARKLAALRGKWPLAFPAKPNGIRPLAIGAAGEIAAAMGWSLPFTLGVLGR
jgi:hypothetical protein